MRRGSGYAALPPQVKQPALFDQFAIDVTAGPTKVHPHVAAISPTRFRKRLSERRDLNLRKGIVFGRVGSRRGPGFE